jgi:hypothetical protein
MELWGSNITNITIYIKNLLKKNNIVPPVYRKRQLLGVVELEALALADSIQNIQRPLSTGKSSSLPLSTLNTEMNGLVIGSLLLQRLQEVQVPEKQQFLPQPEPFHLTPSKCLIKRNLYKLLAPIHPRTRTTVCHMYLLSLHLQHQLLDSRRTKKDDGEPQL